MKILKSRLLRWSFFCCFIVGSCSFPSSYRLNAQDRTKLQLGSPITNSTAPATDNILQTSNATEAIIGGATTSILSAPKLDQGNREQILERFPNGAVRIERWVSESKNGDFVNDGEFTQFDLDGNVVASGKYSGGDRVGIWSKLIGKPELQNLVGSLERSFQAPFESKANFKNGTLDGDWTCSDAKGDLIFLWAFKDGLRHGESFRFGESGVSVWTITYAKNLADGPASMTSKGKPLPNIIFSKGKHVKLVNNYFPATKGRARVLESSASYLVPSQINLRNHDWETSQVAFLEMESNEAIKHGDSIAYFPNGQIAFRGQYDHGNRVGGFQWWYPNGQKKVTGNFVNDLETGNWSWWYENGARKTRGSFANGSPSEEWSSWSIDGKLLERKTAQLQRKSETPRVSNSRQRSNRNIIRNIR